MLAALEASLPPQRLPSEPELQAIVLLFASAGPILPSLPAVARQIQEALSRRLPQLRWTVVHAASG
eukprot:4094751-Prymnesium_polylepis.1